MTKTLPPVPDPEVPPKSSQQMAAEGESEGAVLPDDAHTDEIETERGEEGHDPQFAVNGE